MAGQFPRQDANRPDPEAMEPTPDAESPAEDKAEGQVTDLPNPAVDKQQEAGVNVPEEAEDDQPNVSPEEQAMYDTTVTAGLNQIFAEESFHTVVEKLKAGQDNISKEIGHSSAMIMQSVRGSAEKEGHSIPDDVMFAAGSEIVAALCQVAIAGKLMQPEQEKDVAEAAMYEGMRVWGNTMGKSDGITPEIQSQAKADLEEAGVPTETPKGASPEAAPPEQGPAPTGGIVNAATAPPGV